MIPAARRARRNGLTARTVGITLASLAANLAIAAGADIHEVAAVRERLAEVLRVEKHINLSHAKQILEALRVAERSAIIY